MSERDADVIVVGAGGAGLAAAVSAAEAGAAVLVLEGQPAPGGKTALAMGSITASETHLQARHGVADTNAAHREDLLRHATSRGRIPEPDDPSVDILVEDGASVVAWLESLGVTFSGPHPERPHRAYRLHCAVPDGSAYVRCLAAALARHGGAVRADAAVTRLALQPDGVDVTVAGAERPLRAGAVVLAAGDYSGAVERFRPGAAGAEPIRAWARGDGQALAAALGAELRGMQRPLAPSLRFADPPYTEPDAALYEAGAIVVDAGGRRLDADGQPPASAPAVAAAPAAFAVFGGELVARLARPEDDSPWARDGWRRTGRLFISTAGGRGYDYLDDVLARPGCARADTPAALARAVGLDVQGLAATLAAVNAGRGDGRGLLPIAQPPFVALGPLRLRLLLTDGGIRVDASLRALRADGTPLPGVYAAGNAAAAIGGAGAHGYGLGWAFASGRRAGRAAAAYAR
ncbi:MAG TPA: FAD-dependent oxidoreductase [Chloroflexota bacterium]|nr:FAD-dependent oxidoreductase [Chloroflexota bacterium]